MVDGYAPAPITINSVFIMSKPEEPSTEEDIMTEHKAEELLKEYLKLSPIPSAVMMPFKNYKMTTLGKLFFSSLVVSMMTGQKSPFKVSGDKKKIDILVRAVQSSKRFQDEVKRPGATVDSVIRAMDLKNVASENFEQVFGVPFPL